MGHLVVRLRRRCGSAWRVLECVLLCVDSQRHRASRDVFGSIRSDLFV